MIRKTISQYECCKSMLTAYILECFKWVLNDYKTLTKETVVCYIGQCS